MTLFENSPSKTKNVLTRSRYRRIARGIGTALTAVALSTATGLGAGCVSVNIGQKAGERSEGVDVAPPPSPFEAIKTRADGAWQNKANGNSISYFSTCNDPADPPLDSVARELFADMKNLRIIRQFQTTFGSREALDSEVEGSVEGVPTRIRSMIFKKNGCMYTISYVGITKAFDEDRQRFDTFLRSFRAP